MKYWYVALGISAVFICVAALQLPRRYVSSACSSPGLADANCDGRTTLADFEIWRPEYLGDLGTDSDGDGNLMDADFDANGTVGLADFQNWRTAYLNPITPMPSATVVPTEPVEPTPTDVPPVTEVPLPTAVPEPTRPPTGAIDFSTYPNLLNTGIAGVGLELADLTTITGGYTTVKDGEVISKKYIKGGPLKIKHNNVKVEQSYIEYDWPGEAGDSRGYAIDVDNSKKGTLIEDTTVKGGKLGVCCSNYTVRRSMIYYYHEDGMRLSNDTNVYDSYIHSPTPNSNAVNPHVDGMQSLGGNTATIKHNTIEGPLSQTSAIIAHAHVSGDLVNYTIEDNILSGGGYSLNLDERNSSVFRNVVVKDNVMLKCSGYYGPYDIETTNFTFTNPRYDDGSSAAQANAYKGIGAGKPTCTSRRLLYDAAPTLFFNPPNAIR